MIALPTDAITPKAHETKPVAAWSSHSGQRPSSRSCGASRSRCGLAGWNEGPAALTTDRVAGIEAGCGGAVLPSAQSTPHGWPGSRCRPGSRGWRYSRCRRRSRSSTDSAAAVALSALTSTTPPPSPPPATRCVTINAQWGTNLARPGDTRSSNPSGIPQLTSGSSSQTPVVRGPLICMRLAITHDDRAR